MEIWEIIAYIQNKMITFLEEISNLKDQIYAIRNDLSQQQKSFIELQKVCIEMCEEE